MNMLGCQLRRIESEFICVHLWLASAERLKCSACRLCMLLGVIAFSSTALAHRLDEYLQATLVTIDPVEIRFQINLTPGVEVADEVLDQVDRDHDGVISTNEASAYCE